MESIWDNITLRAIDKLISGTSFNNQQIQLLYDGLSDSEVILDLYTGFANLAKKLVENGKEVHGLDINPDSIAYAREKVDFNNKGRFSLHQGSVNHMDYNCEFDGVSCVSSLDFTDSDNITARINRALRPKGKFAVTSIGDRKAFEENMKREIEARISDGSVEFTQEEIARFQELDSIFENRTNTSEKGLISALEKNGFAIKDSKRFFYDTCSYILAQKN